MGKSDSPRMERNAFVPQRAAGTVFGVAKNVPSPVGKLNANLVVPARIQTNQKDRVVASRTDYLVVEPGRFPRRIHGTPISI